MLSSVDMFIPYYTGKIIDILGQQYQASEFMSAVLFMAMYSIGRYERLSPCIVTSLKANKANSLFWLFSSVSAGCRGGLLLCAISAFMCRIRVQVFGALTKQEIAFFEKIKTGKTSGHET